MTVVAITGVSGCLGRNLLEQLEVDAEITHVLGIDIEELPPVESSKLTFVRRSVTEDFSALFVEHGVQIGIHLAFALNPVRDREREEAINIQGTKNFLSACAASNVETVCVTSSATVYGALPDNPEILYEGSPIRAQESFPYAADKARVEELCYDFVKDHPQVALQIVRPCMIVGPNTRNYLTRMLERPVLFSPWGKDPAFQFVHEDDATRAIYRLVKLGKFGVFNLAGDGALTLSQIAQLAERRCVQLPVFMLRLMAWFGWVFGLNRISEVPPGFVDYIVNPWLIAGLKIKNEAYFLLRFDTASAFLDYLEQRDGIPLPPEEDLEELSDLEDSAEELDDVEIPPAFILDAGELPFQADDSAATESEATPTEPETDDQPEAAEAETDEPEAAEAEETEETDEPEAKTDEPEAKTDEPEAAEEETDEPEAETEAAGAETDEPEAETDEPEAETDEPEAETDEPEADETDDTKAESVATEVETTVATEVETTEEVEATEVEVTEPEVTEAEASEAEASEAESDEATEPEADEPEPGEAAEPESTAEPQVGDDAESEPKTPNTADEPAPSTPPAESDELGSAADAAVSAPGDG